MTADRNLEDRSTPELLKLLSIQMAELVHEEVDLAKAELGEKTRRLGRGAGSLGAGAVIGLLAAGALTAAAIAGIATVLSVWLSALVVGATLAVISGAAALLAAGEIAHGTPPVPTEAIESSKEDVAWLRTQAKSAKR